MWQPLILLAASLILINTWFSAPAAAAVEIGPGVVAEPDQAMFKELVAAFDQAEAAVQKADLDALMKFYGQSYNYHGLKRSDVRRVWAEVFLHYHGINSRHVFSEFKLTRSANVTKAFVTCTGGLYGTEKQSGEPVMIDSWVREVHSLVKENGMWRFQGNTGRGTETLPAGSAPHHPLF